MKISNIPNEVWLAALDNEGIDRPESRDAQPLAPKPNEWYIAATSQRGYTDGGLEQAIHDYMTLSGPFDEENGEFAGVSGFEIDTR